MLSNQPAGSSPSYPRLARVWSVRIFGLLALISLILAQTVLRSSPSHDFCLGFGTGVLIVGVIASFSLESVSFRNGKTRSDVEHLPITR